MPGLHGLQRRAVTDRIVGPGAGRGGPRAVHRADAVSIGRDSPPPFFFKKTSALNRRRLPSNRRRLPSNRRRLSRRRGRLLFRSRRDSSTGQWARPHRRQIGIVLAVVYRVAIAIAETSSDSSPPPPRSHTPLRLLCSGPAAPLQTDAGHPPPPPAPCSCARRQVHVRSHVVGTWRARNGAAPHH